MKRKQGPQKQRGAVEKVFPPDSGFAAAIGALAQVPKTEIEGLERNRIKKATPKRKR